MPFQQSLRASFVFAGLCGVGAALSLFSNASDNLLNAAPDVPAALAMPESKANPDSPLSVDFAPPSLDELQQKLNAWITHRNLDKTAIDEAVGSEWLFDQSPTPEELFEVLMRTFYLADSTTREMVDACRQWKYSPELLQRELPSQSLDQTEPLLTNNVRYFLARHFTQLNAYNDAMTVFEQIDPQWVVDPAGLLFHRAVCEHHLLMKKEGISTLSELLKREDHIPLRYRKLAELMKDDLEQLKEKSLGEVARQMKDVERRLSLQQTGDGVREVEDQIIATLDDLIKQMEEQQQQQQASSSAGGGGNQSGKVPQSPSNEAPNGGRMDMTPQGETQAGGRDHWGDLPPKEKEAAKNMLETEFPAHYRAAVEQYLKKLAERPATPR